MVRYKSHQNRLLRYLSIYTFLSFEQMLEVGVAKYREHLSGKEGIVNQLSEAGLIKVEKHEFYPSEHKRRIVFLTKKGCKRIKQEFDDIFSPKIPKSKKLGKTELNNPSHTMGIVRCHIALRHFDLIYCKTDFVENRTKLNFKGTYRKPDINIKINTPQGEKVYLLEFERGIDPDKSFKKTREHITMMFDGRNYKTLETPTDKMVDGKRRFNFYTTLWVFENEQTLQKCMQKCQNHIITVDGKKRNMTVLAPSFLFKQLDTIEDIMNWTDMSGKPVKLFLSD